jgi:hypothetical protein
MLKIRRGIFSPRSFSSIGRMLFPAMTWKRPARSTRLWIQRMRPAAMIRIDDRIVPVRMAVKLPPLA